MGYILDLRKLIGPRLILITGSCVLIFNESNELLLQKRADNGLWGVPGGSMEPGETFEECALRETEEETGLHCRTLEFWKAFSGKDMYILYPNGDEAFIASIAYLCRDYEGTMKVQEEEASEQRFFPLEEIPEALDPISAVILKAYLSEQ
ncbi:MAG: NUDIX domain-containing protein [Solobacterium sp.]|nr:NUDIX domain-containing protein [Solobacterium sp.]